MKSVKQFFSSQVKSICLLFTIVVGGFLTLSSCSPACDEGNYLGTVEECEVTADTTSSGGGSGGSSGGSNLLTPEGLTDSSRLSVGGTRNGYVLDNGSVVTWGERQNIPDDFYIVDNLTNVRQISGFGQNNSSAFSCAVKNDHTTVCWGENGYGQLGDGTTTNRPTPAQIASVGTDNAFVTGGAYHVLLLKADGALMGWGKNNYGQLGNGGTSRAGPG